MKLKENLILRQVASIWVVIPVGSATVDFTGMLNLNESGTLLWNVLKNGGDRDKMAETLMAEYDVEKQQAYADIDMFLEKLNQAGCIEA